MKETFFVSDYLERLKTTLDKIEAVDIYQIAYYLDNARRSKSRIFIAGNGGSAAAASHMACDLAKTAGGFGAIALTDNVPLITAWGNDSSYDKVFGEQLYALSRTGDLLIVISASGRSPNIIEVLTAGRHIGMTAIGLLGMGGGQAKDLCDHAVIVPDDNYGRIEDAHMIIVHMLTEYFKTVY